MFIKRIVSYLWKLKLTIVMLMRYFSPKWCTCFLPHPIGNRCRKLLSTVAFSNNGQDEKNYFWQYTLRCPVYVAVITVFLVGCKYFKEIKGKYWFNKDWSLQYYLGLTSFLYELCMWIGYLILGFVTTWICCVLCEKMIFLYFWCYRIVCTVLFISST